jgi:hypothetical protein
MRLLIDTDAFCKLAVCGLLKDAVRLLGANWSECGRLPALPHMLRSGCLRNKYGDENCKLMLALAESVPPVPEPGGVWLEKLVPVDPGEAQLFAAASEFEISVLTGDKRALKAVKDISGFPAALEGRIIVVEAVLIALCNHFGTDRIRRHLQPLTGTDQMIKICFSNPGSDPLECLRSYFSNLSDEAAPLVLWDPWSRGA